MLPSLALQEDNRLVVTFAVIGLGRDILLARLNPDGSLNGSFGTGGIVITALPEYQVPTSITVLPDGMIVVAGIQVVSGEDDFLLARYHPDGSLDSGFGVSGIATSTGALLNASYGGDMAVRSDSRFVVVGTSRIGHDPVTGPDSEWGLVGFLKE